MERTRHADARLEARPDGSVHPAAGALLTDGDPARIDAYWRAANHLSVGQIYLLANPLLREPLTLAHVKPRLRDVSDDGAGRPGFRVGGPSPAAGTRTRPPLGPRRGVRVGSVPVVARGGRGRAEPEPAGDAARQRGWASTGPIESFFSTLERERLAGRSFVTRAEVVSALFDYIEVFYNRPRKHSTLGYLSPAAFEARASTPSGVSTRAMWAQVRTASCPARSARPGAYAEQGLMSSPQPGEHVGLSGLGRPGAAPQFRRIDANAAVQRDITLAVSTDSRRCPHRFGEPTSA